MSEYEKKANDFAARYGVTMTAEYLGHYQRLSDFVTAQFKITLRRGKAFYSFTYSDSLHGSWRWRRVWSMAKAMPGLPYGLQQKHWPKTSSEYTVGDYRLFPYHQTPTMYSILACLTKCDPGTHEEFCMDFGYDIDSRKGLEIYLAVQEEWRNVDRLFHDCLEELAEIN
jgi:hypothetical protein